jgi:RNA polymerase primary sigma factor
MVRTSSSLPHVPPTQERNVEERNLRELVVRMLRKLDPRSRKILVERFGLDGSEPRTLEEVGKGLNLSRERVRQLEDEALDWVRGLVGLKRRGKRRRLAKRKDCRAA